MSIAGVEMRVVDSDGADVPPGEVGEIAIRGHNIMRGYYNRPEATAEVVRDGWFRSGDLGRRDKDGYYYIVDRAKDMIIRGGFNVYPRDVEDVLLEHPAADARGDHGRPAEQAHGLDDVVGAVDEIALVRAQQRVRVVAGLREDRAVVGHHAQRDGDPAGVTRRGPPGRQASGAVAPSTSSAGAVIFAGS